MGTTCGLPNYLMALFENRPTGIFLILETSGRRSSVCVTHAEGECSVDADPDEESRNSFWTDSNDSHPSGIYSGERPVRRFYIEVEDLNKRNMEVKKITSYLDKAGHGATHCAIPKLPSIKTSYHWTSYTRKKVASRWKKTAQTNPGKSGTGVKKLVRMAAALREGSKRPSIELRQPLAPTSESSTTAYFRLKPTRT